MASWALIHCRSGGGWRTGGGRRKLTQQVFADRLGKSKSWVDKVERGVRSLDKLSTLQEIAAVLEIEAGLLLGGVAQAAEVAGRVDGVERIRAALSTYEVALGRPAADQGDARAGTLLDETPTWPYASATATTTTGPASGRRRSTWPGPLSPSHPVTGAKPSPGTRR